jgi:hypothetical protein
MGAVKLTTGNSVASFLDGVIKESVKSALYNKTLQEKEKQVATSGVDSDNSSEPQGGVTDDSSSDNSDSDSGADKPISSKTMDDEQEKLKKGNIEPDDIIEKLNAIRSGKSFKDDVIFSAMDEYISSLSKAEKIALLAFLKGIAQIVTGEITAQAALDPSDNPSDIQMQKGNQKKVKHVQPNVITTQIPKSKKSDNEENTEAPTAGPPPITAKKR